MKKIMLALLLIGGLTMTAVPAAQATSPEPKVYVCHWANGNPTIINIAVSALVGHFDNAGAPQPGHEFDLNFGLSLSDDEEDSCTGRVGPQGPPGEDGTDGADGEDGEDGADGPAGPQGPAGENGTSGGDGSDGIDGTDGEDGSGADGIDGVDGVDGVDGLDGVDGEDVDPATVDELYALITELNNRLFILEHTDGDSVTTTTTAPAAPVDGALPKTGSGLAWMAGLGLLVLAVGLSLRFFRSSSN